MRHCLKWLIKEKIYHPRTQTSNEYWKLSSQILGHSNLAEFWNPIKLCLVWQRNFPNLCTGGRCNIGWSTDLCTVRYTKLVWLSGSCFCPSIYLLETIYLPVHHYFPLRHCFSLHSVFYCFLPIIPLWSTSFLFNPYGPYLPLYVVVCPCPSSSTLRHPLPLRQHSLSSSLKHPLAPLTISTLLFPLFSPFVFFLLFLPFCLLLDPSSPFSPPVFRPPSPLFLS